jgi:hypothetical protein
MREEVHDMHERHDERRRDPRERAGGGGRRREEMQRRLREQDEGGRRFGPREQEEGEGSWGGLGRHDEEEQRHGGAGGYGLRREFGGYEDDFGRGRWGDERDGRSDASRPRSGGESYRQGSYEGEFGQGEFGRRFGGGGSGFGGQQGFGREDFGRGEYGRSEYGRSYGAEEQEAAWGTGGGWRRYEGPHAGKGPKGYRRSDERVLEDACQTLERHPRIDASEISVTVDGGVIVLSGTVDSRETKRLAEQAVEDLPGVRDVRNELRAQPLRAGGPSERSQTG